MFARHPPVVLLCPLSLVVRSIDDDGDRSPVSCLKDVEREMLSDRNTVKLLKHVELANCSC